jgi:hypothetical protein
LYSAHFLSDRQPQPIQSSSKSRVRVSAAIRSSSKARIPPLIRRQSAALGVRSSGNFASSAPIASIDRPSCCAIRMKDSRRISERRKRRCPPALRNGLSNPFVS